MKRVILTYDNEAKPDGIGAQLQRIMAIYSICRKFRLKYFHSAVLNTIEERAHNAKSQTDLNKLIAEVNESFEFPSDQLPSKVREVRTYSLGRRKLLLTVLRTYLRREFCLIKICLPFGVIEKNPNWYEYAGKTLRQTATFINLPVKNQITVHIRYGYKPIEGSNKGSTPRFLPLEYYPLAVSEIIEREGLTKEIPIVIQTDIPEKQGIWKPFQAERIYELNDIGYEAKNDTFAFDSIDLRNVYFENFPNVTVRFCDPLMDTIKEMSSSKYLLMSRSSFSYIAGVINPNNVFIPRKHNHAKLSRWSWDFPKEKEIAIELLSGI